jgi:hypothetical protein
MKKILALFIVVVVVIGAMMIRYKYNNSKYSDVTYAARHYITTGVFNNHKLYKINDMKVSFSDGNMAVMTISGLLDKAPHNIVKYEVILEKKANGVWKVTKVYS